TDVDHRGHDAESPLPGQPGRGDGGIEAPGVRQHGRRTVISCGPVHEFGPGERHVSPPAALTRFATTLPFTPSVATIRIALSPATVPSTPSMPAWSMASATAFAAPGGVIARARFPDGSIEIRNSCNSIRRRDADDWAL